MRAQRPALNARAELSGKRILITGTTGFLAKVILEKLIRTVPDVAQLILLIRADQTGSSARARFEREIASSSVFDKMRAEQPAFLEQFFANKIECITGEVTEVGFGLPLPFFAELSRRVDLVINTAASVNFREALDVALRINALSLENVAALARSANAPLIQISTCYVNGHNRGEMREHIVHPAGATIARHREGYYDIGALLVHLQHRIDQINAEVKEPVLRARRLTELGIEEANYYGWNDTYTFTKWMGEQLAMRAMQGRTLTIVRPSIIESTLQEPAPGWIEGVKVADAIILAYARGKTSFFPAMPDEIIDIIPADLVANGVLLAAAEALAEPDLQRVYQACTGSSNPVLLGKVIDLIQAESKRNWRSYERLFYHAPQRDFQVVSRRTFLLVLNAMRLGAGLWSAARRLVGADPETPAMETLRTTHLLALTFSFYTAPQYRFHNTELQALARRFSSEDTARFPVDAGLIDWPDYLCRIHMAGLNRYALRNRRVPVAAKPVPAVRNAEAIESQPG
jgi:fatty acyl-CoA reductase